jgi:hypothetical protein
MTRAKDLSKITTDANFSGTLDVTGATTLSNNLSVDGGTIKLDGNYPVGSNNVALGNLALDDASLTGGNNVAIGNASLGENTSGGNNVGIGSASLDANTSGNYNVGIGTSTLTDNTTGSSNVAVGREALQSNTTASNNTAVGYQALTANTTASNSTAVGYQSLFANTTGYDNVAMGGYSATNTTTGIRNVSIGTDSMHDNITGSANTVVGWQAHYQNEAGNNNTVMGWQALFSGNGADSCVAMGREALEACTGDLNTALGYQAGQLISTGTKNTIIGTYDGNQGGLDIRTSSNNIVLSDGDGNPRVYIDSAGTFLTGEISTTAVLNGSGAYINGSTGSFYASATGTQHYFNRQEDGNILTIRRLGGDSGNIGTNSAKLYISSTGNSGLKFRDDLNCIMPCNADGTNSDADQDLGQSGVRFKTLFLSGGIRLGGTGTANELDDYEEGTWAPQISDSDDNTVTMNALSTGGTYTKVGKLVTIGGRATVATNAGLGSVLYLSGLPFTAIGGQGGYASLAVGQVFNLNITSGQSISLTVNFGDTRAAIRLNDNSAGNTALTGTELSSDGYFMFSGIYYTDA